MRGRGGLQDGKRLGKGDVRVCRVGCEGSSAVDGILCGRFGGDGGVTEGFKGCFSGRHFIGEGSKDVIL